VQVLTAVAERLATADEIYSHGEQARLANVAATIVARAEISILMYGVPGSPKSSTGTKLSFKRLRRNQKTSADSKMTYIFYKESSPRQTALQRTEYCHGGARESASFSAAAISSPTWTNSPGSQLRWPVITEAGNDPSVAGLVYIAAYMPDAASN
jgi:predicted CxxxxCH...CXXCH cytochrome family protein